MRTRTTAQTARVSCKTRVQALVTLLALWALGIAPPLAEAGVYRYIDDRGVVHLTNIPGNERYQSIGSSRAAVTRRQRERRKVEIPQEDAYDPLILRVARDHRLEPALVKAVIAAESNFEPRAVSRAGAQGLMQLMPATARELGVENSFHPVQNVRGGTRYLRQMLDRYGDLTRALAAYNAGPAAVDRYRGVPPYRETQRYVRRVLNYYRGYKKQFRPRPARLASSSGRGTALAAVSSRGHR